jgi:hypothetical protein
MEVDEPEVPPFDPSQYKVEFPFFKFSRRENELTLLGRNATLEQINIDLMSDGEKYMPIIVATSRGMGKTFLLKALGSQRVPEEHKNKRIQDALSTGRILSFDFSKMAADSPTTVQEARKFPTLLMIYFLCYLFRGTQVDGIHFEFIENFSDIRTFVGRQKKFNDWLLNHRTALVSRMMDEYIRLTNLAFKMSVDAPPVFLLDEVQLVCTETEIRSKTNKETHHTLLTLILTELAVDLEPICICTGTNIENVLDITQQSSIVPSMVHLCPLLQED